MTRRVGDHIVIEATRPRPCSMCREVKELRPYGPGGSSICFDCAMKPENKDETKLRIIRLFEGTHE